MENTKKIDKILNKYDIKDLHLFIYLNSVNERAKEILHLCNNINQSREIILYQDKKTNDWRLDFILDYMEYDILYAMIGAIFDVNYSNKSNGEKEIEKYLISNNITYLSEYTFIDLPKKRFDFYIPSFNLCIEFDGIQHFEPVFYFGGESTLQKIQENDNIKNKYCNIKNINLLRIHYSDINNIDKLIEGFIDGNR